MIVKGLYNTNITNYNHNKDVSIQDVLESFTNIETSLYEFGICKKTDLNKASILTESYIRKNRGNPENNLFVRKLKLFNNFYDLINNSRLNEWMQRGFDTFDEFSSDSPTINTPKRKYKFIKKESPCNKIIFKDGCMFAGKRFSDGEIIEEAPMRIIHVEDTYSKPIRDLTFEVDGEKGLYAIPFGYAGYYRVDETSPNASYDFVYDPETGKGYVVIRALKPIMKNDEITIIKDRNKFSEKKYDRFTAANGYVREVPVKNFRFI